MRDRAVVGMIRRGLAFGLMALALSACSRSTPISTGHKSGSAGGAPGTSNAPAPSGDNANSGMGSWGARQRTGSSNELTVAANTIYLRRQQAINPLRTGLEMLAAKRFDDALISFQVIDRNDPVTQVLIARVKHQIELEKIAAAVVNDVQAILDDDKPEEAAKLAERTLRLCGATSLAERLMNLKRQADALLVAMNQPASVKEEKSQDKNAEREERIARLRHDAGIEKDKRLALLDLEQAVRLGGDAETRSLYTKAAENWSRYQSIVADA